MKRFFEIVAVAMALVMPASAQPASDQLACGQTASGQSVSGPTARELIEAEPHLAFGNMYPYHPMDSVYTQVPDGYEAFYISHFGRHGSRYDTEETSKYKIVTTMREHYEAGRLTPKGEQLYRDIMTIRNATDGHCGELTALGAKEHREIAERMYARFPQIFDGKKKVDTYTTMVQRVIDSRDNFIGVLRECNTDLDFSLNYARGDKWALQEVAGRSLTKEESAILGRDEHIAAVREELWKQWDGSRFAAEIFRNPSDASNAKMLMYQILTTTRTLACLDEKMPDVSDYFTAEELYHLWCRANMVWYSRHGITEDNEGLRADVKGRLMAEAIIEDAQQAIASKGKIAATLRFGHDGDLNPLLSFLDIEGTNCNDLYKMSEQARDFEIVRTGANLQLIFYRNAKGDVLVKALRNEKEARIGDIKPYKAMYYRWKDVRKYWTNREVK